ncbi:ACT domain-containing protein [Tanacetum coccineum]
MALCLYRTFNGPTWHVECNFLSTKLPKNSVVGRLPLTKALGIYPVTQSCESYGSDTSLAKSLTEESKVRRNHHTVVTLQTLRPTLLYDTVCTITDMQFAAYHGVVHIGQMEAYQDMLNDNIMKSLFGCDSGATRKKDGQKPAMVRVVEKTQF